MISSWISKLDYSHVEPMDTGMCLSIDSEPRIVSEYDQEIPQSQTADKLMPPRASSLTQRNQQLRYEYTLRYTPLIFLRFSVTSNVLLILMAI